jgi:serine/threonine protein phosphatase PrpC
MNVGWRSEVGHVRQRNEDAFLVEPDAGIFAVLDGMGGHPAGDVASATAVRRLAEVLVQHGGADGSGPAGDDGSGLLAALNEAHSAVREEAAKDEARAGMGTTVVVAAVREGAAWVGHVGDSRAYLLAADGALRQVTRDHGAGGYLAQALGLDRGIAPDVTQVSLGDGDALMLCTDGLTNMVEDRDIESILRATPAPQDASDALVAAALDAGGVDNVTVVVITP